MMETAQDQELKSYFENKLRRARFIINAVEQRRETLTAITREILKRQEPYFLGTGQLKPMTLEEIADALEIHKSTVSRAIRDKYLRVPSGCFLFRSLFINRDPIGRWKWRREQKCRESEIEGTRCCGGQEKTVER